ncbi:hydroxymethylglutaryl-CoA synthase [Ligilactobacillus ceti]|uniref:Hydroxymethylglutaryl-CoA synthase n=1 Tax=Ligilactobacillus ceti DSM 22408 TaxID=1122146 RepID=A0A0R2KRA9_9LACO|nr:hydroxymethylglutaryl-CoA synthase [Ligilactobacillus ceti]KRN88644.1 hydroxymethylglutaryl-CoA synthase [Ligilactobacillus ceti DSM 22408]
MKIGIDKASFYTADMYVDMAKLALERNEDPNKYLIGIGQHKMAVTPPSQDIVTLAANAAAQIITPEDREQIDMVIFGTESGIDNSKSAAIYVASLLGLKNNLRTFEIKQACYGATAALQMAKGHIALHPDKKVLVLGADIARYGLRTKGEPTQGGGAVALLISQNPHILALEDETAYYTEDVMDFWRPIGRNEAVVDGKFSANVYLDFLQETYQQYTAKTGYQLSDYAAFVFHLPFTKMGIKAMRQVILKDYDPESQLYQTYMERYEAARKYNMLVGNIYTGSMYLSLISLLENATDLRAGQRIGFYSYGSGAIGEFFAGILQPGYQNYLQTDLHQALLAHRQEVSVAEYEEYFDAMVLSDEERTIDITKDAAQFVLSGVHEQKRQYLKRTEK